MPYYRTEGVILKAQDFGEADRLLTFLSPAYGKLTGIAKGAKKLKSTFSGKLEPFTRLNFFLAEGKNLDIVSQIEVLEYNPEFRADLLQLAYAGFLLELFENFTIPQEKSTAFYRLLLKLLELVKTGKNQFLTTCWGMILLLKVAGFQPPLDDCHECKQKLSEVFLKNGNPVCPQCAGARAVPLKSAGFKLYHFLLESPPETLSRVTAPVETLQELFDFLYGYICGILNKNLKSTEFLRTFLTLS